MNLIAGDKLAKLIVFVSRRLGLNLALVLNADPALGLLGEKLVHVHVHTSV